MQNRDWLHESNMMWMLNLIKTYSDIDLYFRNAPSITKYIELYWNYSE